MPPNTGSADCAGETERRFCPGTIAFVGELYDRTVDRPGDRPLPVPLAGASGLADSRALTTLGELSKKAHYQRVYPGQMLAIEWPRVYYLECGIDRREEAGQQDLLLPRRVGPGRG